MTQITSGAHSLLSHPFVYDSLQIIMGARGIRKDLVKNFIKPKAGQRLLDIGCGTAHIASFLPANVSYVGFDISRRYVDYARSHLKGRGDVYARPFTADLVPSIGLFDTAIAIGLLHHLSDGECDSLFKLVQAVLKPGGRLVTFDGCLVKDQNPIARFIIEHDRGQNIREPASYKMLAQKTFQNVFGQIQHRSWIPYTHFTMECS